MSLFNTLFDLENGDINQDGIVKLSRKTYFEKFDDKKLQFIIEHKEDVYDIINRPNAQDKVLFENYLDESDDNIHQVKYFQHNNGLFGRHYAPNGAASMLREVRHTIFYDTYHDYDFTNCHPVILSWLCKNMEIECPKLHEYINNRDELMKETPNLKILALAIINGGKKDFRELQNKSEFIIDFYNEMRVVRGEVTNNLWAFYNKAFEAKENSKFNMDGSCMAYIMQFIESQLLNRLIKEVNKSLTTDQKKYLILCFDGIMIPKDVGLNLPKLNKYIKDLGIDISLIKKEMKPIDLENMGYDPNDYKVEKKSKALEIKSSNAMFDKFNKERFSDYVDLISIIYDCKSEADSIMGQFIINNIAFIINSGDTYYITKNFRKNIDGEFDLIYNRIEKGFSISYKYKTKNGKICSSSINSLLLKLQPQITYQYADFIPFNSIKPYDYNDKEIFNTFTGFMHQYEEEFVVDQSIIDIFLFHIKEVMCNGVELHFDHFVSWLADIIQNPAKLSEIRYILQSEEGAGKNILFYIFMDFVIGRNLCLIIDDIDKITGRFNGAIEGKLLVVLDEACNINGSKEAHKTEQKVKSITTNKNIVIEQKGKEVKTVNNFARNISLTNNDFAGKTGRRANFLKMNNDYIGNTKYFDKLLTLGNPDSGKHLFHYFTRYNITINLKKKFVSDYELELMYLQTNTVNKFLIDTLQNQDEDGWIEDFTNNDQIISAQDSFTSFEMYCEKNKFNDNKNVKYFSKLMIDMLGKDACDRKYINGKRKRVYMFKIDELKTKLCLHFKNNNLFDE